MVKRPVMKNSHEETSDEDTGDEETPILKNTFDTIYEW